ncbi:MAG: efflux RND transporter periplasmic adaptor subunit [Desulfovibrio sp.]|jgi:membrane fusion protein (multidrug efflux system)|nr:efflux RND transporter periplasmic adaptor subunit [Desulfovibrio sp.]
MKNIENITAMIFLFCTSSLLLSLASGCENKKHDTSVVSHASVRYQTVTVESITLTRELPGRISAFKVSEVRPQVDGIIQTRLFEEGADVLAGQVLYRIDPALYQAAYNKAKADLTRALANEEAARLLMERCVRLVRTGSVSVQERDDAIAAYHQLQAEIEAHRESLASAAISLGYTKVTAPVSGRIGHSFVTEGALVTRNQVQPLAKIQQMSPVYVDIRQPSSQLLKLKLALASGTLKASDSHASGVRLRLEYGTPYKHPASDIWLEGKMLFSDISVDESTGTVILRATFDNPDGLLLPGMYVRATLVEGVLEKAILVPQRCVFRDTRNLPQVFVLQRVDNQDGSVLSDTFTVEARTVVIDREHQDRWLLSSGLKPGELLLVDGLQKVRRGQTVYGKSVTAETATDKEASENISLSVDSRQGR